ncbi:MULTISPECIES: SH3 domain-containing protein [Roseivirga]|jgi:tetratricopeptide (TPR) repeat protein|uniref:SH3 domain-containing protein n=1 Tax=Roseivirga TaxID=290180 RepID=UPI0025809B72|nr:MULTISPECIES: SH3 domain-containing protein [Roseivirga]MEC7755719.1 SH3 domain-containing protein [Bacteroidota bacterium]|tara:strand:- start:5612 stop:6349 length:738 start_codon:yes stop_codon:yes gene_type:complete
MQKRGFNFLNLIFLALFLAPQLSNSQDFKKELEKADSLFSVRKYTQSLSIYEKIYQEQNEASPAMLLKMAYSNEAMGNIAKALLYLHDYLRITGDEEVLDKMKQLASVNGLEGYNMSQFEKAKKAVEDYKLEVLGVLFALAVLIVAMIYRKIQKHGAKSPSLAASLLIILALIFYVVNLNQAKTRGLVMQNKAYLMTGPSAAAELVEIIDQGHKVEIIGKKDIWYEIKWRGQRAYIRENNLKKLL